MRIARRPKSFGEADRPDIRRGDVANQRLKLARLSRPVAQGSGGLEGKALSFRVRIDQPSQLPFGEKWTWCDCGGRSPVANEVRYVGLMDISREENDLWNIMLVWMCH